MLTKLRGYAMKGTATKILDSRYSDFVEALQKLGELQSMTRMIVRLSYQEDESWQVRDENLDPGEQDDLRIMHDLWQMGWLEVREITVQSKNGLRRKYVLKVCLEEIARFFEQEKLRRSSMVKEPFQAQKERVPA
jgi:predicted transcriptional regulator